MYSLVIFGALLYVLTTIAQPPDNQISDEQKVACMEEAGLSKDDLEFHRKNHHMGEKPERDPRRDCFVKCIWTTTGVLDKDGNIDIELLKSMKHHHHQFSEEEVKTVSECAEKVKTIKECEDIGKLFSCFPRPKHPHPPPSSSED